MRNNLLTMGEIYSKVEKFLVVTNSHHIETYYQFQLVNLQFVAVINLMSSSIFPTEVSFVTLYTFGLHALFDVSWAIHLIMNADDINNFVIEMTSKFMIGTGSLLCFEVRYSFSWSYHSYKHLSFAIIRLPIERLGLQVR